MSLTKQHDELNRMLTLVEADAKAAAFFSARHRSTLPTMRSLLDVLKRERADWLTADDEDAKLVRRMEAIVTAADELAPGDEWLPLKDAAKVLGCVKGNTNKPRNTFYAAVKAKYGKRTHLRRSELTALREGGL